MRPELAVDVSARLGEGPVWDEIADRLYWVDILAGLVHVHDPAGAADRVIPIGEQVGSIGLYPDGALLLAARTDVRRCDPETGAQAVIARCAHAEPARFNDGKCAPDGYFFAGTITDATTPGGALLYRLGTSQSIEPVLHGLTIANGLGWSPDGTVMYHIDTPTGRIDRFDYRDGTMVSRLTLVQIPAGAGVPDGLCVDAEGGIWVALWDGGAVHRYTPDGRLDRVIEFPIARPTCPTFGGPDLDTLYVTSARGRTEQPHAGALWAVPVGVAGLPTNRFGGDS
jgi:sugar lactone lactonase YvrE